MTGTREEVVLQDTPLTKITSKNGKVWKVGEPVKVYSNSLDQWCPGEISEIFLENNTKYVEVKYWSGTTFIGKSLDIESNYLRSIHNVNF